MTYRAPVADIAFALKHAAGLKAALNEGLYGDLDEATVDSVLEEAGKFAAEIAFPLNQIGDAQGCTLDPTTHEVKAPAGFKEAYARYVEGGWPALSCDPAYGGQGLPLVLN